MKKNGTLTAALVAAVAGLALVANSASAQVFSVSPGLAVPPSGTGGFADSYTVATLTVAGGPTSISDVNVIFNQTHTWNSDLDIILIPPGGGSYLKLTTDNGGSGDNYTFTRFDDLSSVAITAGASPFNNNYRPEGGPFDALDTWFFTPFALPGIALTNLGGLNGTDSNGDWTLVLGDDVGGDIGVLQYLSLEFNGAVDPNGPPPLAGPQPPQATMTTSLAQGVIGSSIDVFVTVTPGGNPVSTGIAVSCDANAIDGGTITLLDNGVAPDIAAGDLVFSGTAIVGASSPFGIQTLTGNVLDAQGRTATATSTFNVIPPPPSNDECSNPIALVDGSNDVSNVSATSDGSAVCTGSSFEVYYSYTASVTGPIQVDTCAGASFDTVLAVFDSCGGTQLACNDDFCGLRSQLTFDAVAGQTYIVRLASFGTFGPTTGTATLTIGVPPPTPIDAFGFATPDPVFAGNSTLLQVQVFPGEFPDSTGIVVTCDTSNLQGGSSSVAMNDLGLDGDEFAGDFIYSATLNVANEEASGTKEIGFGVIDDQARTAFGTIFVDVVTPPQYVEVGDAGDLIASAQSPTGTDPFISLGGNIEAGADADMYLINICDFANFGATTVGTGTTGDTQLFLFNLDGTGVTSNDDSAASVLSTITSAFLTANGNYYLGVVRYNLDPVDETGQLIWNNTPFGTERQPDGPGALGSVAGWLGTSGTGNYQVNFTGTCFPSSVNLCNYDYNQDENVDLTDAQLMAQVAAGLIAQDPSWLSGDMNGDENADLTDAQQLAAFVASGICPV